MTARKKKEAPRTKETVKFKAVKAVSPVAGIKPYESKKGEKYMNKKQLEHFRKVLNAWRQELEDEIQRAVNQLRDEPENPADMNDRASQETDMSLELRSRDREGKLIKKIDETLERIDDGEYGYCDNCGVEIGVERLEARPTAELCIDCKTLDEHREKQMG
jgi:DnaK suppressor protein